MTCAKYPIQKLHSVPMMGRMVGYVGSDLQGLHSTVAGSGGLDLGPRDFDFFPIGHGAGDLRFWEAGSL